MESNFAAPDVGAAYSLGPTKIRNRPGYCQLGGNLTLITTSMNSLIGEWTNAQA